MHLRHIHAVLQKRVTFIIYDILSKSQMLLSKPCADRAYCPGKHFYIRIPVDGEALLLIVSL
jgi:hypothetical protein